MPNKRVTTIAAHRLTEIGCYFSNTRFEKALRQPELFQRKRLHQLLKRLHTSAYATQLGLSAQDTYEQFQKRTPIVQYEEIIPWVQQQRSGEGALHPDCRRFQPTSGSTSKIKWIPYSPEFLNELDEAISPWLISLFANHPGIRSGRHYWSLSWIPTEQRASLSSSDDRDFFPLWKRILWSLTQAGSPLIANADTIDSATFATATYLCSATDLSMISVWSPTFALSLFEGIRKHRHLLSETLATGRWPEPYAQALEVHVPHPGKSSASSQILRTWNGELRPDFLNHLWPNLSLISAWDTSSSRSWALQLAELLPHAAFEGKGLWATEGVVTIPYFGKMTAAVTSHFMEWRDLDTQQIHPTWELRSGQIVQPILSTGSGLLRYALSDQLRVTGKNQNTPTLEFLGRMGESDLAGEKISPQFALQALQKFEGLTGLRACLLIADPKTLTYTLWLEIPKNGQLPDSLQSARLAEQADQILRESFHYALARELKQIQPTQIQFTSNFLQDYQQLALKKGMIEGNLKFEPLIVL